MAGKSGVSCIVVALGALLLPGAAAAQDAAQNGAKLFRANCFVCHTAEAGVNKIGPSLFGVVGRKSGTAPGFTYSAAMKNAGIVWTPENIDKYLADPKGLVPNNKMIFLGLKKPEDRQAVIAYLSSLK